MTDRFLETPVCHVTDIHELCIGRIDPEQCLIVHIQHQPVVLISLVDRNVAFCAKVFEFVRNRTERSLFDFDFDRSQTMS